MKKKNKALKEMTEKEYEKMINDKGWESDPRAKEELLSAVKDAFLNIRINSNLLLELKTAAQKEGIPHTTLVHSILHKYLTGQFVDKEMIDGIIEKMILSIKKRA